MNVTDILDRPIAFHRVFVELTGSVNGALLLSQALYWQKRARQADGFWYKTTDEWTDETGLTRRQQDNARRDCGTYLEIKLKGMPAQNYYRVNEELLAQDLLELIRPSSLAESAKQDAPNRQTSLAESDKHVRAKTPRIKRNAETTPETTHRARTPDPQTQEQIEAARIEVDAILAAAEPPEGVPHYEHREKIPEAFRNYADTYVRLTGQKPTKRAFSDWLQTFQDWFDERLLPSHIEAAWERASDPDKGFLVGRPGSLTRTAIAIKSRGQAAPAGGHIDRSAVEKTKALIAEREVAPSPMPDEVRARLAGFAKSHSVDHMTRRKTQ